MRVALTGLGLRYVAAIMATTKVRHVRKDDPKPPRVSVEALALSLPKHAWRTITWREGTNEKLQSRFARVRVHAAPIRGEARFAEETLLIEWPEGEAKPTKYWLATADRKMSFRGLVDLAKMRSRIERDYEDLKQESGLGHYDGPGSRRFPHHGPLPIRAYGFLISERARIPPSPPPSRTQAEARRSASRRRRCRCRDGRTIHRFCRPERQRIFYAGQPSDEGQRAIRCRAARGGRAFVRRRRAAAEAEPARVSAALFRVGLLVLRPAAG